MNPTSRETPGISLPPPVAEAAPTPGSGGASPEQAPATPEMAAQPAAQPAAALPPLASQPGSQQPVSHANNDDSTTTSTASSPLLNNGDRLEKEWADKIKRIIKETRHDPYRQSEQLTLAKADYMKQRYNKVIKVEK